MRCTNPKCKAEIKLPLDLYNGDMACPICRKKLDLISGELQITERGHELFELSELWFSYGLMQATGTSVPDSILRLKLSYAKMINKAIDLCREASSLGHPEARWRLGFFYDKDYADSDKTESVRTRIAAKYYASVFMNPAKEFNGYGREKTVSLKQRAARDFCRMLSFSSKDDRESFSNERTVAADMLADFDMDDIVTAEKSDSELFGSVIAAFSSQTSSPVFGVVKVSCEALDEVLEMIRACHGVQLARTYFSIIPLDNESGRIALQYRKFTFSYLNSLNQDAQRACKQACGKLALFYLNLDGKHNKRLKLKTLHTYLSRNSATLDKVAKILGAMGSRCAVSFTDDDFFYTGKANAQLCFDEIISKLNL